MITWLKVPNLLELILIPPHYLKHVTDSFFPCSALRLVSKSGLLSSLMVLTVARFSFFPSTTLMLVALWALSTSLTVVTVEGQVSLLAQTVPEM